MNQNQARLLVVGIIILLLLSATFFFRKEISNFLTSNKDDKNANIQDISSNPTLFPTPAGPLLRTGSLVKEYNMNLLNDQAVLAKLKELNIFGREYLHTKTQTTGSKPLSEVDILLTKDSQNYEKFYGNNSYIVLFNGVVQIYFSNLDDNALSDPAITDTILEESIGILYTLRYPDVEKGETTDFVKKVVKELKDDEAVRVVITRN